jgi:hypothetical protein
MAHSLTISAATTAAPSAWPYFHQELFESFAIDFQKASRTDYVGVNNLVSSDQRDSFVDYVTQHHQDWTKSSHQIAYGNLDLLDTDPSKYNPFISRKDDLKIGGTSDTYIPDRLERDFYLVRTTESPPPRAYGPSINYNVASNPDVAQLMTSLFELRNESLLSNVQPYRSTLFEDEALNFSTSEDFEDGVFATPHSYVHQPILRVLQDSTSEIVATITAAVDWGASLQSRVAAGNTSANGVHCVIENDCNDMFTFEIVDNEAIYSGRGDKHLASFDYKEVFVDLAAVHAHPNYTTSPGHCRYTMVSLFYRDFSYG